MHRTDDDGNISHLFDEGDPMIPRQPTQLGSAFMNAVQEELCNAIEYAGVTLVKGTWDQLKSIMVNTTIAQTISAVKTFTKGIILVGASGATDGGDGINATGGDGTSDGGTGGSFLGGSGPLAGGKGIVVTPGQDGSSNYADAIDAVHGDLRLRDGAIYVGAASNNPGASNRLVKQSTAKAWATITSNSSASPAVSSDKFNIGTVTAGGTSITVNFALALTTVGTVIPVCSNSGGVITIPEVSSRSTSAVVINFKDSTGANVAPNGTNNLKLDLLVMGT